MQIFLVRPPVCIFPHGECISVWFAFDYANSPPSKTGIWFHKGENQLFWDRNCTYSFFFNWLT